MHGISNIDKALFITYNCLINTTHNIFVSYIQYKDCIMPKKENRVYSRYTDEAIKLLAKLIRTARLEQGITTQALAERAGISRDLLYRIEHADPACSIGVVFEVATLLKISLFQSEYNDLALKNKMIADKLALLPSRAHPTNLEIDDDF